MTRYDLGKLMHETTHRSMNVDPGVVDVLGVGGSNINYTKGKWEYDPEEFGFTGPVKYPQDTSEIFTRRVDADSWDAKDQISKEGEFQTDIEVADAAKLDKRIHDPILDRRTGVHWRTRGAGAAPGEALRARLGIRSIFDPYVDKYKEVMGNYKGGENYYLDVEKPDFIEAKKLKKDQFINRKKKVMQEIIRKAEVEEAKAKADKAKADAAKSKYSGPITHSYDPKQGGGGRPDAPGGFTDPGKGSYGPWKAKGGVARKNYFHGGILDINESEEIISDDGNDIELTDYNAAFDDPNDLSTGVRTLFMKKGGNVRLGPHTATDLLAKKNPDGTRSKYQPPGGGATSLGSGRDYSGSDRGPRDDPDRFGPTTETKTTTTTGDGGSDARETYIQTQYTSPEAIAAKNRRNFDYETEAYIKTVLRPQQIKTLTIMDKYENKIKPTYRDKFNDLKKAVKLGKNVMGATSSLFGFLSAGYALYKHYKEDKAFVDQLNKDIQTLKGMGIADFHHAVDTPVQTLEQLLTDRLNARLKKDDIENNEGPKPIYTPLTGEVSEEYAQGDYDFDQWSNWNAMKQKQLLNAQLQEQWRAEKEASDQSFLVANRGGLANLFRVKNQ
jgi:hypothetical protein